MRTWLWSVCCCGCGVPAHQGWGPHTWLCGWGGLYWNLEDGQRGTPWSSQAGITAGLFKSAPASSGRFGLGEHPSDSGAPTAMLGPSTVGLQGAESLGSPCPQSCVVKTAGKVFSWCLGWGWGQRKQSTHLQQRPGVEGRDSTPRPLYSAN